MVGRGAAPSRDPQPHPTGDIVPKAAPCPMRQGQGWAARLEVWDLLDNKQQRCWGSRQDHTGAGEMHRREEEGRCPSAPVPLLLGAGSAPSGIPPEKRKTLPHLATQNKGFLGKILEKSPQVDPEVPMAAESRGAAAFPNQPPRMPMGLWWRGLGWLRSEQGGPGSCWNKELFGNHSGRTKVPFMGTPRQRDLLPR